MDAPVVFPPRMNILIDDSNLQKLQDESYDFPELNLDIFKDKDGNFYPQEGTDIFEKIDEEENQSDLDYMKDSGALDDLLSNEAWELYQSGISDYTQYVSANAAAWSYIQTFLQAQGEQQLNMILSKTGLSSIYNLGTGIFQNFENLKAIFGSDFGGLGAFGNTNQVLDAAINILQNADVLIDRAEEIIDIISEMPDKIEDMIDSIGDKLDQLANTDFSNLLDALPNSILDSLMNIQITSSLFSMFNTIRMVSQTLITTLTGLKAPSSIRGAIGIVKQIKALVNMLQSVKNQAENTAQQLEMFMSQMKNGGLVQLALQIAVTATGGLSFLEHPTQYAAKYPENQGYTTAGGHTIEVDSTKGKERFKWSHPANSKTATLSETGGDGLPDSKKATSFEVHPNGTVTLSTKGDDANIQLVSKKRLELDADEIIINAKSMIKFQAETMFEDISGIKASPGKQETTDGPNSISGTSVNVNGTSAVLITSPLSCEMMAGLPGCTGSISINQMGDVIISSGPGPLGNSSVIISATSGITLATTQAIKIGAVLGISENTSGTKLSISSLSTEQSGIITKRAGLIRLNS